MPEPLTDQDILPRTSSHPDDPPAFELVNAGGAAPFLLICDHATRFLPRSLVSHIARDVMAQQTPPDLR